MPAVLVLPPDPNPYQRLLYDPLPAPWQVRYPPTRWLCVTYPLLLVRHVLTGGRIVHLHWLYWFAPEIRSSTVRHYVVTANVRLFLLLLKLLRLRLVWTVHNLKPHESQTRDDEAVARRLATSARRVIVHSPNTSPALRAMGVPAERICVVPHGSYVGLYESPPDRVAARTKLGLDPGAAVVLFFGQIRAYKGVDQLLDLFGSDTPPPATLLVAGRCVDAQLQPRLDAAANANIVIHEGTVPDSSVGLYFAAADVVALPFRKVTTSGSALLALSLGRPVVAPRLGDLTALPEDVGFFYDPDAPGGLAGAVAAALDDQDGRERAAREALRYAGELSWDKVSEQTAAVFAAAMET